MNLTFFHTIHTYDNVKLPILVNLDDPGDE